MLTTTLDGLWALQVLSGYEVLAPELGLRPYLPSAESKSDAMSHAVARDLAEAGVIDADGIVDDVALQWLSVLSGREVGLLIRIQIPTTTDIERILLARRSTCWVALRRYRSMVQVYGLGTAATESSAGELIKSLIDQVCGDSQPAQLRPATLDVAELLAVVQCPESLRNELIRQGLDRAQLRTVTSAADSQTSAHACVVAVQSRFPGETAGSLVAPVGFSIIDTPQGRLVSEGVEKDGKHWMIVSPGSSNSIASAVRAVMRRLPAGEAWHESRKVLS